MYLKTTALNLDNNKIDVAIGNFSDKILIVISETQKFGSVMRVDREIFNSSSNQENVYNIRTLFGTDRNEDHLLVRILSDNIQSTKPMIFIVNLKKYSENILKNLIKILKELTSEYLENK